MNFWDFVGRWNGRYCEVDGVYPNQCVDLTKAYFEALGLPKYRGSAWAYGRGFHPEAFHWEKNTLWGEPARGDIVVVRWGRLYHVGICISANHWSFDMLDQNAPVGSVCSVHRYNYIWPVCVGWLKPRVHLPGEY